MGTDAVEAEAPPKESQAKRIARALEWVKEGYEVEAAAEEFGLKVAQVKRAMTLLKRPKGKEPKPKRPRTAALRANWARQFGPAKKETLKVTDLAIDPEIQSRVEEDERAIEDYSHTYKLDPAEMPPIVAFRDPEDPEVVRVADGFQRYQAARASGQKEVEVQVHKGPRDQAILYAVGSNEKHGVRRTRADRRKALQMLAQLPGWASRSERDYAQALNVSRTALREAMGKTSGLPKAPKKDGAKWSGQTSPESTSSHDTGSEGEDEASRGQQDMAEWLEGLPLSRNLPVGPKLVFQRLAAAYWRLSRSPHYQGLRKLVKQEKAAIGPQPTYGPFLDDLTSVLRTKSPAAWVQCARCQGTGRVEAEDGKPETAMDCKRCKGFGFYA